MNFCITWVTSVIFFAVFILEFIMYLRSDDLDKLVCELARQSPIKPDPVFIPRRSVDGTILPEDVETFLRLHGYLIDWRSKLRLLRIVVCNDALIGR